MTASIRQITEKSPDIRQTLALALTPGENPRQAVENLRLHVESLGKAWGKARRKIRIVKTWKILGKGRRQKAEEGARHEVV
jgi:hypothetical protein